MVIKGVFIRICFYLLYPAPEGIAGEFGCIVAVFGDFNDAVLVVTLPNNGEPGRYERDSADKNFTNSDTVFSRMTYFSSPFASYLIISASESIYPMT